MMNQDYQLDVNGDARITSSLGVNTTPNNSYKLDVNGDARLGWNGNSNYIYVSTTAKRVILFFKMGIEKHRFRVVLWC